MRLLTAATLVVLAALPLALVAPAAQAAQAGDSTACRIGDITRVFGGVSIIRNGNTVVPETGESFCVHDRFVTNGKGVAELKFRDGSLVTVGKDTEFVIAEWRERLLFANTASFELVKGAFRALTGAITQRRHRVEVKTAIATIGVRGTEFWGGLNLSPEALEVVMLQGKGVYVKNDAGMVELTTAGTGTTVKFGKTPTAPNAWSPEKVSRAVETITP